jgi:hypothetical protein
LDALGMNEEGSSFGVPPKINLPNFILPGKIIHYKRKINKGCVTRWPCHLHKKKYLKAKEELWKLKSFTMQKKILIFKKSSERNQNPSRYYNSIIANLKFTKQAKISSFKKSSYKNRPIT